MFQFSLKENCTKMHQHFHYQCQNFYSYPTIQLQTSYFINKNFFFFFCIWKTSLPCNITDSYLQENDEHGFIIISKIETNIIPLCTKRHWQQTTILPLAITDTCMILPLPLTKARTECCRQGNIKIQQQSLQKLYHTIINTDITF